MVSHPLGEGAEVLGMHIQGTRENLTPLRKTWGRLRIIFDMHMRDYVMYIYICIHMADVHTQPLEYEACTYAAIGIRSNICFVRATPSHTSKDRLETHVQVCRMVVDHCKIKYTALVVFGAIQVVHSIIHEIFKPTRKQNQSYCNMCVLTVMNALRL